MKQYTVIIAAGITVIVIVAVIFSGDILKLSIPTQEYDIFVDPILIPSRISSAARKSARRLISVAE